MEICNETPLHNYYMLAKKKKRIKEKRSKQSQNEGKDTEIGRVFFLSLKLTHYLTAPVNKPVLIIIKVIK